MPEGLDTYTHCPRQECHGPSFQAFVPVVHVPFPYILLSLIRAPGANRPLVFRLYYVYEPHFADQVFHSLLYPKRLAKSLAAFKCQFAAFVPHVSRLDRAVVGLRCRGDFELLQIATGSKMAMRRSQLIYSNWYDQTGTYS